MLIEDNPGDVRLIKEALKQSEKVYNLNVVDDGIKALSFLRKENNYKDKPRPDLIMLDFNISKKDGLDLLAEIKEDQNFKYIPVIILTRSKAKNNIISCYKSHANCYITKPVNLHQFINLVKTIELFWFSIVKLPPNRNFG